MNEEIKEILDTPIFIIDNEGFTIYINDKIENYITNLQKENNQHISDIQVLMNKKENLERLTKKLQKENEKLKDTIKKDNHLLGCNFSKKDKYKQERDIYKQRNEKAVEYIKNKTKEINFDNDKLIDVLNILEGGDE